MEVIIPNKLLKAFNNITCVEPLEYDTDCWFIDIPKHYTMGMIEECFTTNIKIVLVDGEHTFKEM